MSKTSITDPILIAAVTPGAGHGRIGMTFCPGKIDPHATGGGWQRDLDMDLDAIRKWGASTVVTLIEDHEFDLLHVETLGEKVRQRHMDWLHLPIRDVSVPNADFETIWKRHGEGIRARLRDGSDVVVHCRGGLGRAGTIAARLLIELGMAPARAVSHVRSQRSGAIETAEQMNHVLACKPVPEPMPSTDAPAIRDRAVGAMLGLAAGDALGTTLEFRSRDSYAPQTDMVGGGPFNLRPGEWTDDTAMARALADSLIEHPDFDAADLISRFSDWHHNGTYSCTGRCFDIGITTRRAIAHWHRSRNPYAGSTDPDTAGNGSLMRLAPVAIRFWSDRGKLRDVAARQSRTTHAAPEAIDACIAYAEALADAIEGKPRSEVLAPRENGYAGSIGTIMAGSWRGKPRDRILSSGYVAHSLEASLWSIGRSGNFRSCVLLAANLGEDADTTAAIAGQLAGALYGASNIPSDWLDLLAWKEHIEDAANRLVDQSLGSLGV